MRKPCIEAQTYAKEFYEKLGFIQISVEFSEDGIPHIKMVAKLQDLKSKRSVSAANLKAADLKSLIKYCNIF